MSPGASSRITSSPRIPEVDGLRALAIALVVIYHFDLPLSGGFVGVDLFFAISGFVIARNIASTIQHTQPASFLRDFYTRRVLRLFPAALVLCITMVSLSFIANDFSTFGDSSVTLKNASAGLVGVANWFLLHLPGMAQGEARPLAHMWSLSIEEQFYLALPLLLLLFRRRIAIGMFSIGAGAIAISIVAALANPTADEAFFSTTNRIGPVGAGVILAGLEHATPLRRRVGGWRLRAPALGLLLAFVLAFAVVAHWDATWLRHGGFAALSVPFAAVVALAAVGGSDPVTAILRSKPAQIIGARSYSLYLWHYPVAFLFNSTSTVPRLLLRVLLAAALTEASFRLVENPIRRRSPQLRGRVAPMIPIMMVVGAIVMMAAGALRVR